MAVKLFIGNLSFKATDDSLQELFSGAGEVVSARVITDRESGRSRGFGFVEMSSKEEAEQAIEMFNNYSLLGRNISVDEAKPREVGSGGRSGGYSSNRGDN